MFGKPDAMLILRPCCLLLQLDGLVALAFIISTVDLPHEIAAQVRQ